MKFKTLFSVSLFAILLTGCAAQRPVLFDNAAYKKNPDKAEKAIDACLARAEKRGIKGNQVADAGSAALKGGLASGAAGAAGSSVANGILGGHRYSVGASAGASAAAGAAGNFVSAMLDSSADPVVARYVETCLLEKGYKTVTWH